MRRRRYVATLTATVLCLGGSLVFPFSAEAVEAPGSGFVSAALAARAVGLQFDFDTLSGQPAGGTRGGISYTESTASGFNSRALSSITWPGALGGNLGKLLTLAGGEQVPKEIRDQYYLLDWPLVAEAQSAGPTEDTLTVPGATMTASARETAALADSVIGGGLTHPFVSAGTSRASSLVEFTGENFAEVDARTYIEDIRILDVLRIGSVVSHGHVTTDGIKATVTGTTTFTDMTVQGTPITVDGAGVHIAGNTAPTDAATAGINQVLTNFGITLRWTEPTKVQKAGAASYTSGALVVVFDQRAQDPAAYFTLTIGAVHAGAKAANSTPFSSPSGGGTPLTPDVGGFTPAQPGDFGGTLPPPAIGPIQPPNPSRGTANNPIAVVTREVAALPDGLKPLWVLGFLMLVGMLFNGLRGLPDRALAAGATACPLEEKR